VSAGGPSGGGCETLEKCLCSAAARDTVTPCTCCSVVKVALERCAGEGKCLMRAKRRGKGTPPGTCVCERMRDYSNFCKSI